LSIHSTGLGKDERPRPKYCSIAGWSAISGMWRSTIYQRLARGDFRAIKLGARTLIKAPPYPLRPVPIFPLR